MSRRVVILDRDGTLNVDHGYVYKIEDWEFTNHAIDALRLFRDAGFSITVVTNQSGIAQGRYLESDLARLHSHVLETLAKDQICIAAIAYCPHSEMANCDCRKPRTGMAHQLECQLGTEIDYADSWTIGDKLSDLEFGRALGTRTAIIGSRYWSTDDLQFLPDLTVDSLFEAAREIVGC